MDEVRYADWQQQRCLLVYTDEEEAVLRRWRELKHRSRFPGLTPAARLRVLQFLPVYGADWVDDLAEVEALLASGNSDVELYDRHEAVLGRVEEISRVLRDEHMRRYGDFAVYARALGLGPEVLCELPERAVAKQAIGRALRLASEQRARWVFVSDWVRWYEKQVDTPCRALRMTLRPPLRRYIQRAAKFTEEWADALAARLQSEQEFLCDKLDKIDAMGDPRVTKGDLKNMFWQLGLPFDDSVGEDYPASITFHQAYTLGLFETTHMRHYLWEDRQPAVVEDEHDVEIREKALRRAREKVEAEELAREQAAAAARREAAERIIGRARDTVCERLGARLWSANERGKMPYTHRWAGCELYGTEYVHWVAVALQEGTTDDVVLSEKGAEEYEGSRVVHGQYLWLFLQDLVDGAYDGLPSIGAIARDVRQRRPHRSFNEQLAKGI
eukprot:TRINITY_DN60369_c0_g1_i1.p1 TRINITY_DN60369_c0_g1~~TRINITY_DN60369_c0_g1_i1.p1  ORF type:complete len:443 (+),score=147.26 TRINITY_DN60369_c0_g1_i1:66-1394(+)